MYSSQPERNGQIMRLTCYKAQMFSSGLDYPRFTTPPQSDGKFPLRPNIGGHMKHIYCNWAILQIISGKVGSM